MNIQERIDAQRKKVNKLETDVQTQKAAKEHTAQALNQCMDKLCVYSHNQKAKKSGIIWLVISGLLAIAEVLLLTEIIPGYGDFQFIDLVIIGIPLFFGIRKMKSVLDLPQESIEELDAQRQNLQAELARYDDKLEQQLRAARNDLDNMTRYTGRNWDISTFTATPENVAAMEKDFEDLLIALKYSKDRDFKINCWLSANEIKRSTAEFNNQKSTVAAYDRGTKAMKNAGSWKLEVALIAMGVLTVEILNAALSGGYGKGTTFEELLQKSNVRKPANKDEEAILALTGEVMADLAAIIRSGLMRR